METEKSTIWTKPFISLLLINLIASMGQSMSNSLIPKYADFLGAAPVVVGFVTGSFSITALAIRPIAGSAFDYFNKKVIQSLSIGVVCMAYALYANSRTVPLIIVARLIHGIGMGCRAPLTMALASEVLPDDKLGRGIGVYSLAQAFAIAVGPSTGLTMLKRFGYQGVFMIVTVIMLLAFLLSIFLKTGKYIKPDTRFQISLKNIIAPEAVFPAVVLMLLAVSSACISSYLLIYGSLRQIDSIGLYFTVYSVALIVARLLCGRISDKYGHIVVVVPAIILNIAAFVVLSGAKTLTAFLVAAVLVAFGHGVCNPILQTLCMKRVPKERRGTGSNTNYIGVDIGNLLGPVIAGQVIGIIQARTGDKLSGYSAMYLLMTLPMMFALALVIINSMIEKRRNTPST